ncbi:MAG: OmpA family protein [Bryobacteraceae bacterium]|nr:OmpA family protein [Bryobacteraceae bacterium]
MKHLIARLCAFLAVLSCTLSAQMPPGVQRDDWEEINFEFNSSVLTDGFPSLLRLADLLARNSGFRVRLDGHTDSIGTEKYNEKLSQKRAETVKVFLEKYGARPSQIEVVPRGKRNPKVENSSRTNRWINRRVQLTVLDQTGKIIGAGGVGEAIKAMQAVCPDYSQTLAEILKKLDKLDDINRAIAAIAADNARLRSDLDAIKGGQQQLARAAAESQPHPPAPRAATPEEVRKTITETLDSQRDPRFAILGLNAGVDNDGKLTFTGRGRYFAHFKDSFAIQAQGEYLHFNERKEGQFDLGLVSRFARRGQAGAFTSFKHIGLYGMDSGATLGQFAGTLDYIFSRGRVGFFGTKGFLNNQVMKTRFISRNIYEQTYASIVDQAGASTAISIFGNSMVEANLGALFVKGGSNKPGATIRFTQPLSKYLALTLEGGWNETYVSSNTNGRFVAGLLFGNFAAPKEYLASDKPVPVDIPRVRYELLTKRVRTGNDAPVADAGPDQIGVAAGAITLDGSASFDPDGDPITFQWDQVSGPGVDISGRNTAKASFQAAAGQSYSFRLTVKDDHNSMSLARVTVTTKEVPKVVIQRFNANPAVIEPGKTSVLSWQVLNADEVEISGIGKVNNAAGTTQVAPAQTTTYRLTARNKAGEATETVTVTVQEPVIPQVRILSFQGTPASINFGESSSLVWETENADTVTIDGIGTVRPTGTAAVSPQQTTTYRITASNKAGSVSTTTTITVTRPGAPRILAFTADPIEILEGESATLSWRVEQGATEVSISGLGPQTLAGSARVTPAATTTYILTARSSGGEATASVTIKVLPPVRIISFTANPSTLAKPGDSAKLTWETSGATEITLTGAGSVSATGSLDVKPAQTTTYTLIARNSRSTVTSSVTVTVSPGTQPPGPGTGSNNAPIIRSNVLEFFTTDVPNHVFDFSASSDPDGDKLAFDLRLVENQQFGGASIVDRGNGVFNVTILGGGGAYHFKLTVSDGRGGTSVKEYRIHYSGPRAPNP